MRAYFLFFLLCMRTFAAVHFEQQSPNFDGSFTENTKALCSTANSTLAYLNKGSVYDPEIIQQGIVSKLSVEKRKRTLQFICLHQQEMNNPQFIKEHFKFVRWYPDMKQVQPLVNQKTLLKNLPADSILMTKYYVHLAKASKKKQGDKKYPLYGLPEDEQGMSIEQANTHKTRLTRFKYGKQAILRGALENKQVPVLAYLSRDDIEAALLQGTVVADFGAQGGVKIFNVHRCNEIAFNKAKRPYAQERFWYFKQVDGIKGYGKDADHKITVEPGVTFAGDLANLGLGSLLMVQYKNLTGAHAHKIGVLADTGGAFVNNLYQIDYLAGSFAGKSTYLQATRHLPDYVQVYFMVLKDKS